MSANTVCRICLSSDLNLHGVRIDLQSVYEGITRGEYNKDGYPLSMCYICLSALRKCHKFMETVRETNDALKLWYIHNQQSEILAKPLYVYSRSKVEIVSIKNEDTLIEIDIKKEKLDVEYDKVQTDRPEVEHSLHDEYIECDPGVDIEKTDIDEPRDIGDFAEDSPDDTFDDTKEDDDSDDVQTDPLSHSSFASNDDEKIRRKKRTKTPHHGTPAKRRKSKASDLQHAVPGTSRDTGANSETCKDFTSLKLELFQETAINSDKFIAPLKLEYIQGITKNKDITFLNNQSIQKTIASCETSNTFTSANISPSQTNKIKDKTEIKPTFAIINQNNNPKLIKVLPIKSAKIDHNKKDSAKLIKVVKLNTIPKKIKKTVTTLKNKKDSKLSLKTAADISSTKAVTNSVIKTDDNRHLFFYNHSEASNLKSVTKAKLAKQVHNKSRPHVCDVCGSRFRCLSNLNSHKTTVHTGKTNEYFCSTCNFKTTYKNKMTVHLRTHAAVCSICNYKFQSRYDLNMHMRIHTGERPFSCDICEYKCKQKAHLKAHMLNVHIGEKQFSCDVCGYKCTQKSSLNIHMKKHTGEKPFSCNICDYKCISKSYLNIHMRKHTGEKPFSCNICDYKCANKGHLKRHMLVHTGEKPYSCAICSYKCTQKGLLNEHMRTHTGEKPYVCNICGHKSAQKSSLNDHMITHSSEKPFSCDICGTKFARSGCLKRHLLNKHKIKKQK